jgi:hypothetical protein
MSLYVYALLAGPPSPGPGLLGVGRERVQVLDCAGLAVAVGRLRGAPAVSVRALRRHDGVVRALARRSEAVLPTRFGTLVPDRARLDGLLRARRRRLVRALRAVAGREQMTLRVYGRPAAGRRDSNPRRAPRTAGAGAGTRYLAWRRRRTADAGLPEVEPIRRAVGDLVVAERTERHASPPLLASIHHLIPRRSSRRYLAALAAASRGLRGVRVRASGPWPVYAFAPEVGA